MTTVFVSCRECSGFTHARIVTQTNREAVEANLDWLVEKHLESFPTHLIQQHEYDLPNRAQVEKG